MIYKKGTYLNNNTLCIACYEHGGLYQVITVNLNSNMQRENRAFLDFNNITSKSLRGIKKHLKYTGDFEQSGYCLYPLVEFDKKWLDSLEEINA